MLSFVVGVCDGTENSEAKKVEVINSKLWKVTLPSAGERGCAERNGAPDSASLLSSQQVASQALNQRRESQIYCLSLPGCVGGGGGGLKRFFFFQSGVNGNGTH